MQKKYIVIISILLIYMLITLLIFGGDKNPISNGTYIVIDNNTRWKYEDDKWDNLDIQDGIFDGTEFIVYKNQVYQGKYYLQNYNDTWYFFDKNNQSYDLDGQLFAYSSEDEIHVIEFEVEEIDLDELNNLLKKYDIVISNKSELSYAQKVSLDFDNDEKDEYIYSISNLMAENIQNDEFSLLLYVDENKTSEIINDISDPSFIYSISNIIDVNDDQKYELVIEHQKPMNVSMNCHSMYQLKKGKYELLKSCK